ncbi:MAG: DUF2905 domain-containing protein [Nitrospirae bacterium]|nr:DUF2905 domain-containing protein [Nitrospirota bacterium]
MEDWSWLGKVLILVGLVLACIGGFLTLLGKWPGLGEGFGNLFGQLFGRLFGWLGKLPGDILIKQDHVTFYFPLATGLLISLVVSLLLYFLSRRS